MNSERYKNVLEDHLLPSMIMHRSGYFLQDAAPYNASKKIKTLLWTNNIKTSDWPGNSPYLNPIENCWAHMNNMLAKKDSRLILKLSEAIPQVLVCTLSSEYLKKLSDSMPDRLKAVVVPKGDTTKY
jgi:transposase